MPVFKLPLSGDVVQSITPWTAFVSPIQLGLINVTVGQSSEPKVEEEVLSDVASYGKQLGRIEDALIVLLAHFHPATPLTEDEADAIEDLKEMLAKIAAVKDKYKRPALRPYGARRLPRPASPSSPPDPAPQPSPSGRSSRRASKSA